MESYSNQYIIALGAGILLLGAFFVFIGEYRKLIELRPE